jgi:dTMP kinase
MKGFFISFEGVEGSGKSTQAALLEQALRGRGLPVLLTREPGGTAVGRRVREVLLSPEHEALTAWAELFLYLSDRAQHVQEIVVPALREGRVVISDRFSDSSLAYQGWGRGLEVAKIKTFNEAATGGLRPHLTFLLDLPPEVGLGRNQKGPDRLEQEDLEFHRRVRQGYLQLQRAEPERIVLIDATLSPQELHQRVLKVALQRLEA